ncbi:hypothetical protein GP486_005599 [Trichoglossum hirsutum]|uniref:Uncharacterized protein n=1 Tax=Trichoglossum hirsutum TaxID=265104 RepID=A0A9P8L8Y0_9PEZI|nr:hypothetical protein GP486_005599 [Trichoglossum hirsutum]
MTFLSDEVVEVVGIDIGRMIAPELLVAGGGEIVVVELVVGVAEGEELAPGLVGELFGEGLELLPAAAEEPVEEPVKEPVEELVEGPAKRPVGGPVEEPVVEFVVGFAKDEELAPGLVGEVFGGELELFPAATVEPVEVLVVEPVRDPVEDGELMPLDPVPVKPGGTESLVLLAAVTEELVAPEPTTSPVDEEDREVVLFLDVNREEPVPPVATGALVVVFTSDGAPVGGWRRGWPDARVGSCHPTPPGPMIRVTVVLLEGPRLTTDVVVKDRFRPAYDL